MRVAESNRPQVLNASTSISPTSSEPLQTDETVAHKEDPFTHQDERQIMLDTDRSFVHYPSGEVQPLTLNVQQTRRNVHTIRKGKAT